MTPHVLSAAKAEVDAYRCTGTSPGRTARVKATLELDDGRVVDTTVGYEVHGPAHAPAIVVLGGISAGRHLAPTATNAEPGWWPGVVGPGAALDPARHRLIGIDYLGGSGAHSTEALTGGEGRVTSRDQARALAVVLDELGVRRVALIGSSYGGMVGLAFAELFSDRLRHLLVICAAHRTHPMATALRGIQRNIVHLARGAGRARDGMALARALAMTTYRSAREFDQRFDWRPSPADEPRYEVERYLEARGSSFASRFEAGAFVGLSDSIDAHQTDPAAVISPTTLVSFDTDSLVPPWLVRELAEVAPGVERHVELSSIYGHDAFLKEVGLVSHVIGEVVR